MPDYQSQVNGLKREAAKMWERQKEILDRAEAASRDLTAEEQGEYDQREKDMDALHARAERLEKAAALDAQFNEKEERQAELQTFETKRPTTADEVRFQKAKEVAETRASLKKWMISGLNNLTPEDRQRLPTLSGNGREITMRFSETPMTPAEYRVQSVGTTTEGGFTVADEAMRAVEVALLETGAMRRTRATVLRTRTGASLPIPTMNDTGNSGVLLAENTEEDTVTNLTFGQVVLGAYKFSSDIIRASIEFMQDTTLAPDTFIAQHLGIRIGRALNTYFTAGTGSSQPNGVKNVANAAVRTVASATAVTADELIDLQGDLDPGYSMNAEWLFNRSTLTVLRKLKTTDLQYIWQPGLQSGTPNEILGSPYVVNQDMRSIGADKRSILYGDMSKFYIRDVLDFTVRRLDELYATFAQVGFIGFSRHDSDIVDAGTNPIAAIRHPAS